MYANNLPECTCKKIKCVHHGNCKDCIEYHKNNKYHALPYCKRKENKQADKINRKSK